VTSAKSWTAKDLGLPPLFSVREHARPYSHLLLMLREVCLFLQPTNIDSTIFKILAIEKEDVQ
jgi:hypothetical protein